LQAILNRKVTSKQVAERAGVSQTTVSFVLNNTAGMSISEETRQRVLQACRELNYVPHVAARALARGHSTNIALVLIRPHAQVFSDPYIPNIITGLNQVTQQHGYRILVEQLAEPDIEAISSLMRGGEAAGTLISGWYDELVPTVSQLVNKGYPVVFMGQPDALENDLPYVAIDHLSAVRTLIQHLIDLGHRRIACITYAPLADLQVSERLHIYRATLAGVGLPVEDDLLRIGAFDPESGYAAAQSLLDLPTPPDAIYGMNDLMALGAMSAIQERGLRIPDDVAVVGYDDMRFSRFTFPPLTTVKAPEIELGQHAGEMLLRMVQKKKRHPEPISLLPELIVRASCGAAWETSQPRLIGA
jgi:LacI family transcriptional regulator